MSPAETVRSFRLVDALRAEASQALAAVAKRPNANGGVIGSFNGNGRALHARCLAKAGAIRRKLGRALVSGEPRLDDYEFAIFDVLTIRHDPRPDVWPRLP